MVPSLYVDWYGSWRDRRGTKEGLLDTHQNEGESLIPRRRMGSLK